jgi:hypothetical protein
VIQSLAGCCPGGHGRLLAIKLAVRKGQSRFCLSDRLFCLSNLLISEAVLKLFKLSYRLLIPGLRLIQTLFEGFTIEFRQERSCLYTLALLEIHGGEPPGLPEGHFNFPDIDVSIERQGGLGRLKMANADDQSNHCNSSNEGKGDQTRGATHSLDALEVLKGGWVGLSLLLNQGLNSILSQGRIQRLTPGI